MADLPGHVDIYEEGPREGFQIEPGPVATVDKVRLVEALAGTGLSHIQVCSFVNPRVVPGWADADAVVAALPPRPDVRYTALWFNERGLRRALAARDKLTVTGSISLTASDAFTARNLHRSRAENLRAMRDLTRAHLDAGVPVTRIGVMAAFGCNFGGDVSPADVVRTVEEGFSIAAEFGLSITDLSLADTMGWAAPHRIEHVVGTVRGRWPDVPVRLHLHDTRGLAVANALAGLRMGVARFDATAGGLGGCPFAGQKGAAGNICTEELVLLCEEMGVATGVDLDTLIEAGRLAERIVGHALPSALLRSGSIDAMRRAA